MPDAGHDTGQDASLSTTPPEDPGTVMRLAAAAFLNVEHGIYMALGVLLAAAALFALTTAVGGLWHAIGGSGEGTFVMLDQLLFVLMLVEILHTVRVSIRSGALSCEPFLIVGLIASIRRVLVITLESSAATRDAGSQADHEITFRSSMIELGVLAALILVMVFSIYLLRRARMRGEAQDSPASS